MCSLSSVAAPQVILAWMRLNLEKFRWRRIFHRPTGARLIVLQAKKRATLSLLTNCDEGDPKPTKHCRVKPPMRTYRVRAPSTQSFYNKYKCSGDLWNKMVLHYDHCGKTNSADVAVTQTLIHALTLQAFTYWRLATGSKRTHLDFRYDVLRHFAPPPRPRSAPTAEKTNILHCPVKLLKPAGRCAWKHCTSTHPAYMCFACKKPLCMHCFAKYHGLNL